MAASRWAPRSGAVVGRYTLTEAVARGSAASIWRASPSDSEAACTDDVAIKCISGGRVRRELIDTEVETLSLTCAHSNIVTLLEVEHVGQWTCLVMPLAASGVALGPDLEQVLSSSGGKLIEARSRVFFRQVMLAVAHCHSRGVYHGDLKMENVLVQQRPGRTPDPILWLCDFGCATTRPRRAETVGTDNYVAPEAVQEGADYDAAKADMFSLGVLLYTMLSGHFPFARPPLSALNSQATCDAVRAAYDECDPSALQFPPGVSSEAATIVRALLQRDPAARPCAATVAADKWLLQEGVPPEPSKAAGCGSGAPGPSLRSQTQPEPSADWVKKSAAMLCAPNASPQPELAAVAAAAGAARCRCCGLFRPRTLSLPLRMERGPVACDPCC
jgi:5'-AMP-activated protein kinase catalytic alpha subunit